MAPGDLFRSVHRRFRQGRGKLQARPMGLSSRDTCPNDQELCCRSRSHDRLRRLCLGAGHSNRRSCGNRANETRANDAYASPHASPYPSSSRYGRAHGGSGRRPQVTRRPTPYLARARQPIGVELRFGRCLSLAVARFVCTSFEPRRRRKLSDVHSSAAPLQSVALI